VSERVSEREERESGSH